MTTRALYVAGALQIVILLQTFLCHSLQILKINQIPV